jgi:hypothetical protein
MKNPFGSMAKMKQTPASGSSSLDATSLANNLRPEIDRMSTGN